MINIKRLEVDDLKEAALLSNSVFRSEGQEWMEVAFPYIFKPSLVSHSFGAYVGRELQSFMGLVPFTLKIGQASLPIFSLGAVCTHPSARGKGYASQLLEEVKQYIDQAGASLLFISGDRGLYTRADCYHFGATVTHVIMQKDVQRLLDKVQAGNMEYSSEYRVREYQSTDLFSMVQLASNRIAHYETSIHDFSLLLEAEAFARDPRLQHKILVAEKRGQISAFLVVGIPSQQENKEVAIGSAGGVSAEANETAGIASAVAIEWAGEAEGIALLLAKALKQYELQRVEISVPWQETELIDVLQDWQREQEGNQGTVYLVSPQRLIEQLRPYLEQKNAMISNQLSIRYVEDGNKDDRIGADRLTELILGEDHLILSSEQLVTLFFSPSWREELELDISKPMQEGLQELFPIPLPYTAGLQYI